MTQKLKLCSTTIHTLQGLKALLRRVFDYKNKDNVSYKSLNLYINCCLALKFQSSASDTYNCHIIAAKYPAWRPGQRKASGCRRGPAGNLRLSPSRPPPLSGSLASSGMCDSFPALLPQTTARLENSAALIRNGTAVVLSVPRGGVWQWLPWPVSLWSLIQFRVLVLAFCVQLFSTDDWCWHVSGLYCRTEGVKWGRSHFDTSKWFNWAFVVSLKGTSLTRACCIIVIFFVLLFTFDLFVWTWILLF